MIAGLKPYPTTKESGVPWLGAIPDHWEVNRSKWLLRKVDRALRDTDQVVTCFRDGTVTLRSNRRLTGFTEAMQETGYQGIRRGDLVIHAMDAFAGAIGVSDSDGKGTPVYSVCEPAPDTDCSYYAHLTREMARTGWIRALARGIRERSTDFRYEEFARQILAVPPPDEQAAIVRFLDFADARIRRYIRAKQQLIKLLEEQKQSIIHSAVTRGLDASVRLKPSGLAWPTEVPAHWDVLALKHVLDRLVDCEHKTAPAVDESPYRVVRTSAVRHGRLRLEGSYCTTEASFREWTQRAVPAPGDVIFTREAPAGEACVVPKGMAVCLGQRTVLMQIRRDQYEPEFLVGMIYAGPPKERIRLASQGSTVGHFNMDDIGWMHVFRPPVDEQRAIVEYIRHRTTDLERAKLGAEAEISLLGEYRTRLIADVVTGKLDVREAAAALPDGPDSAEGTEDLGLAEDIDDGADDLGELLEKVEV